jgi:hypothetical protein
VSHTEPTNSRARGRSASQATVRVDSCSVTVTTPESAGGFVLDGECRDGPVYETPLWGVGARGGAARTRREPVDGFRIGPSVGRLSERNNAQ